MARRTVTAFYDDQITHHAAALTYYGLMSLFPTLLFGLSLLGLLGHYPETYEAILSYLRGLVPDTTLGTLDAALRGALQSKGTAATALVLGLVVTLYGTTGALEAARRALNVVFEAGGDRSFLRRKAIDIASSVLLIGLVSATLVLLFVGGGLARDLFGFLGLGSTAAWVWGLVRWPAALAVAMLVFAFVYYVTPDVEQRAFRWITPGALAGVTVWLAASATFSFYVSNFADVNATYGSFAAAIVLIVWLWLTNLALLFGAELNAEIEREKEMEQGVPEPLTLHLPEKG
ncbi:MAG: YihY/virulence factor BrkB family protein [Actinomycetota bacterium]|nr:YihY/virulence factor BrkB family protein [Actinomycetota bacterium]